MSYLFAIVDDFIGFIYVSTIEVYNYVNKEEKVDTVIQIHVPVDGFKSFREC